MKHCLFLLLLLFLSTGYSQTDNKKPTRYQPRRIVTGAGINSEYIGGFIGIGANVYAQFRFNDNRNVAGIGIESLFAVNSKTYPATVVRFFEDDTINTNIKTRYYSIPYRIEFHHYLISPKYHRLTARIGGKIGPEIQIVEATSVFPDRIISGPGEFGAFDLGFFTGAVLNFEYFYQFLALTLDISATYHYINKDVFLFNSPHQIGGSVKLGIAFNYGPRNKK